jgi:pyruvate formate lyase activating enzyme
MLISGMEKLTLSDYPDKLAAIIFTQGCNFKCPFCQNAALIPLKNNHYLTEDEVLNYLEKRKKILDGLVISGGEPTLQKDLKAFIKKVKAIPLKVKLDTNGYHPDVLKDLIQEHLIDYVAMDIKNDLANYSLTSGVANINTAVIKKSIAILNTSGIPHEFRTTIIKEQHDLKKIENIINLIGPDNLYYLQNFKLSQDVPNQKLHGFSQEELQEINNKLNKKYPNVKVRGL